jgi:hypothetical protein
MEHGGENPADPQPTVRVLNDHAAERVLAESGNASCLNPERREKRAL